MKRILVSLLILTLSMTAVSCVNLGAKPLDKKYYRMTPTRTGEPIPPQGDVVLKVRRMTVSDLYKTRELVYQMSDGRIESDFYSMFFVTPSNNLTSELRKWLAATGQFSHIIEPGSMVVPTLTLEGTINSLYGDYATDQPTAVIAMQFFVVDENTPNNEIVFSRSYRQRVPLLEADPDQLVKGFTKGAQIIFRQLEQDLALTSLK